MSETEFESYLDLLSRFLRLNQRQRQEIGRELRAHLEDALEDEMAHGVSRGDALRHVLDDFGDAAELAARFSKFHERRRWLMQGTVAAACIGFLVLAVNIFSPDATVPAGVGPTVAQAGGQDAPEEAVADDGIRQALQTRIAEVAFEDAPLEQVIDWLRGLMQVNVHVQWRQLEQAGVDRDTPTTMQLRDVTAECVLRLAVDEFADANVDYQIVDNVLIISTNDSLQRRTSTEVYDVRDVLEVIVADAPHQVSGPQTKRTLTEEAGGDDVVGMGGRTPRAMGRPGAMPGGVVTTVANETSRAQRAADELTELLTNAIHPDTWLQNGGFGYLQILNGILVVRQYEGVHADIRQLLDDMRTVAARVE